MSNFHLQEIQTLQNSLREREEYVIELENRLRVLWDKYDGERTHYMERIKRLEELGDWMRHHSNNDWWCEKWDETKEAKP